jgi:4-amino-4-deoxy-L-arabinose transferase-like glycosyltransferase
MQKRWVWIVLAVLLILLKFLNPLRFPLYLDEGLYIFWAKLFHQSASYAYVSLQDGKTPMFIWLTSFLFPVFRNYLMTARLISLVGGLISLISWFFIIFKSKEKDDKYLFLFLMSIVPMGFLIERLAFVDSLLTAFFSLATLMAFNLKCEIDKKKESYLFILYAVLSGGFLGLAYLTKTTATLFAVTILIITVFWIGELLFKKKYLRMFKMSASLVIGFLVYHEILSYLRVGAHRFWGMIANKEVDFVYTPVGLIYQFQHYFGDAIKLYHKNISLDIGYFIPYFSFLIPLSVFGTVQILKKEREKVWVLIYSLILLLTVMVFAKVTASRYFYPLTPALVYLSVVGFRQLLKMNKKVVTFVAAGCFVMFAQSFLIGFYPERAFLAGDDYSGFFSSANSAYGLDQVVKSIKNGSSIVGVTGIWGVGEGAGVVLEDNGIKSLVVGEKGSFVSEVDGLCPDKTLQLSEGCWKLDLESVTGSSKTDKYLFITEEPPSIKNIERVYNFKIIREVTRPGSQSKTYLLKV